MNRREAIQRTALVLGYAVSAPALAAVLNGCKPSTESAYKPLFFTTDQMATVAEIAEIIMPRTTTPGAKDAGVHTFIDKLLKDIYTKKDQDSFVKGLTDFDEDARKTHGSPFAECKKEDQVGLVKKYHDQAFAKPVEGSSTAWWGSNPGAEKPFILKIKELTLLGFFTSEPGATQVLQYNQVPGPYKGCLPLAEVGKAWAT